MDKIKDIFRRGYYIVLALLCLSTVRAEVIVGTCVGVADGDTCTILYTTEHGDKTSARIRLYAIDAPESTQDFGQAAKKHLSRLIFRKEIKIETHGRDRYQRILGNIYVGKLFVNLEMVKAGMAWWYQRYAPNNAQMKEAEALAKSAKKGLWVQSSPTPPWEYRKSKRNSGR